MDSKRPEYFDKYETIAFERTETGVLTARFHSNGGPVAYSERHHNDWFNGFLDIGADRDNKVVIITGTGDEFNNQFAWTKPLSTPGDWDEVYTEGTGYLKNLLNISVPVIAAVNGPCTIHSEVPIMSDIVLASETAIFQDTPHFPGGIVPGDGINAAWLEVLGQTRAKYFLLSGQIITAQEALSFGVVNEVLPPDKLMLRAKELAEQMATLPWLTLHYTRLVLTKRLKKAIEDVDRTLALEALAFLNANISFDEG